MVYVPFGGTRRFRGASGSTLPGRTAPVEIATIVCANINPGLFAREHEQTRHPEPLTRTAADRMKQVYSGRLITLADGVYEDRAQQPCA
jgi:hypothetical protein